jgi:hypothetical protein
METGKYCLKDENGDLSVPTADLGTLASFLGQKPEVARQSAKLRKWAAMSEKEKQAIRDSRKAKKKLKRKKGEIVVDP